MAETSKSIILKGDKKNPESAEHNILFEGGSISVCRTSNGEYWAHIYVNQKQVLDDTVHSKLGYIKDVRREENHIAVLVTTDSKQEIETGQLSLLDQEGVLK